MTSMDLDVAIIGAGPAGLRSAYELRNSGLRVKVFERMPYVGGRTLTRRIAGEDVNMGAMFVYVGTESDKICRELGIDTLPLSPATFGVNAAGRTVIARDDKELVTGLALPADAAADLHRVLAAVRSEYETYVTSGDLSAESKNLAHETLSEHLGPMHPIVERIVRNAVRGGSTADPDVLSAQYALRYFASYVVHAAGHRVYIPGGMQQISIRLSEHLQPGTLELNASVNRVDRLGDGRYALRVAMPGRQEVTVTASHVVFAVPGPGVGELAAWLPDWKLRAIEKVPTSPTVMLGIVLDSAGKDDWDDIFLITAADAPFNTVLQPRACREFAASKRGRTHFCCYLSADAEAAEPGDDDAMTQEWLEAFFQILPDARGRVLGTGVARWPRCFSYPAPGREDVLDDLQAPIGGAHFAGDFTSATAGSHGALGEGARTAVEILQSAAAGSRYQFAGTHDDSQERNRLSSSGAAIG